MNKKQIIFPVEIKAVNHPRSYILQKAFTNDLNSVELVFKLTDCTASDLTGASASILLFMRDGSFFQNIPTITGTDVKYTLTEAQGNHAGVAQAQIIVKSGTNEWASDKQKFEIIAGLETVVATEVMIKDWTMLTAEARAYLDEFEANEVARQQTFTTNEAARAQTFTTNEAGRRSTFEAKEATRQTKETERQASETSRKSAETGRVNAESSRVSAEQGRTTAEQGRVSAEQERVSAEAARHSEVILARGAEPTLGARLDASDAQLAEAENEIKDFINLNAKNILLNSGFSEGTYQWTPENGSIIVTDKVVTFTGNGTSANPRVRQLISGKYTRGHLFYIAVKIKPLNEANKIAVLLDDGSIRKDIFNPIPNEWHDLSAIGVSGSTTYFLVNHSYGSAELSNGKSIELKETMFVDLTNLFGAGNEPSISDFERLLKRFPGGWFDGEKSLLTASSLYDIVQTQINAVEDEIGYKLYPKLTAELKFENAGLNTSDGTISKSNVLDFYTKKRTGKFLEVIPETTITPTFASGSLRVFEYSLDMVHIKNYDVVSNTNYLLSNSTAYIKVVSEGKNDSDNVTLKYSSKKYAPVWVYNKRISDSEISFLYEVNPNLPVNGERYFTAGLLKLPRNYSPSGNPVKLIIFNHGSSDYYHRTAQVMSTRYAPYLQYLCDEGYAIFDCWGWSSKYAITSGSQMATPTGIACLVQGYKWVTENFNISKTGVFSAGKSLGGLNAVSIAQNKGIPVLAVGALAPELNHLHINLGYSVESRLALADDFGFEGNINGILGVEPIVKNADYTAFVKLNAKKMIGYIPFWSGLIGVDINTLVDYGVTPYTTGDYSSSGLFNNISRFMNVPTKIWIAQDDSNVSYGASRNFIQTINNGQGIGELRTLPSGTGGHHAVDYDANALKVASINTKLGINHTDVPLAYVEMVQFFRRFEN